MKKIGATTAVVGALVIVVLGAWYLTSSPITYSGLPEPITIGEVPIELSALCFIAEDKGFFAGNGLNVTMRCYNTSVDTIKGLSSDEVDMALTTEYAIVREVLNRVNISVIGNIDKYQSVSLVGRKDKGIINVLDLKGKRIGLSRGSIVEFYLGRFLSLHGMSIQDVTLIDMPTSQYVQAFTNGSIDALIGGNIFIDQIKERSGSNVVSWPAQSSQNGYWVIVCKGPFVASHSEQINRLLKSLDQAEKYTINHPDEAKAIIQKRLNYTEEYMAVIWPNSQFALSLDQSLILAMEDEGRWMIKNNLTSEKTIPDFRDYIYTNGLEAVKPESLNVIS